MKRLAVLGQPISHSLSPAIHTAALEALGMTGEWSYAAIEVAPEGFEALVRSLPDDDFVGVNVTVPHKEAALRIADRPSGAASAIGAANTLSFDAGRIRADNTDASGLLESLPQAPAGKRARVLGAGGAARAAAWALIGEGAEVSIWNRTASRAESLASELGANVADAGVEGWDLLVNATSVGLGGGGDPADLPVDADALRPGLVVVDLAYGDEETYLIRSAREAGATAVDGREVLVHQGAASLRIWTGADPPLDEMRRAAGLDG